jgi:hypothetical protein
VRIARFFLCTPYVLVLQSSTLVSTKERRLNNLEVSFRSQVVCVMVVDPISSV